MDATQICGYLDADLVTFIHNIIVVIKIAVPIILVIFGMLDLAKGVVAGKEDEIKKGQQVFIKRLIAAALVFFVITIVQLVMGLISSEDNSFWNCADQILNGNRGYFTDYGSGSVNNKKNNSNNENKENDNSNTNTNSNNNTGNGNNNESGIVSNDQFSCETHFYYEEYKNCLNNGYNDKTCATFFQDVCTSRTSKPTWPSDDTYSGNESLNVMKKVTCSFSDGSDSNLLKKQLYSCGTDRSSRASLSFDGAVQGCLGLMEYYCKNN